MVYYELEFAIVLVSSRRYSRRSVKLSGAAFQRLVASREGGIALMLELGFRVSALSPASPLPHPPRVAVPPPALLRAMRPPCKANSAVWLCDG